VWISVLQAPASGPAEAVTLRVIVFPLAIWLWVGGGVMVAGTALAAFPGRRRNPIDPVSAPVPAPEAGDAPLPPGTGGGRDTEPEPAGRGAAGKPGRGTGAGGDRPGRDEPQPIEVTT